MLADGDLQDEQDYECDEEDNELQELAEMPEDKVFHWSISFIFYGGNRRMTLR